MIMKNLKLISFVAFLATIFLFSSCDDDKKDEIKLKEVTVSLSYEDNLPTMANIEVVAKDKASGNEFKVPTNSNGKVVFELPYGTYEFKANEKRTIEGHDVPIAGSTEKVIGTDWDESTMMVTISMVQDANYVFKKVKVTLEYEAGTNPVAGVEIEARGTGASAKVFKQTTDDNGTATFDLSLGTFEFSATHSTVKDMIKTSYNGMISKAIDKTWNSASDVIKIKMIKSEKTQKIIIKEIYFGGCPSDVAGEKSFNYGEYITLYNNSTEEVDLKDLCIGSVGSNSYAMHNDIHENETQPYWFKEDWTPAGWGYFYFPNTTVLKPGQQVTVAVSGGIDHTQTYPNSVNLANAENYVMYDIDVYNHKLTYPAPAAVIPPAHYLDAVAYGPGTAWVVSQASPSIFLFYPQGVSPKDYGNDRSGDEFWRNSKMFPRKKVPSNWVVDAVDVFAAGYEKKNVKRLNPKIDNGFVYLVNKKGYTIYRNVNKAATEAIPSNKGKLVYDYAGGTNGVETKHGTTDPSGIDAEASAANGAIIIYQDTNDSGKDFHLRKKSALKK